jgi:hypothetical protein
VKLVHLFGFAIKKDEEASSRFSQFCERALKKKAKAEEKFQQVYTRTAIITRGICRVLRESSPAPCDAVCASFDAKGFSTTRTNCETIGQMALDFSCIIEGSIQVPTTNQTKN